MTALRGIAGFCMWYYVYILELNNGNHYVGCTLMLKNGILSTALVW
jgi:hypothetical protein